MRRIVPCQGSFPPVVVMTVMSSTFCGVFFLFFWLIAWFFGCYLLCERKSECWRWCPWVHKGPGGRDVEWREMLSSCSSELLQWYWCKWETTESCDSSWGFVSPMLEPLNRPRKWALWAGIAGNSQVYPGPSAHRKILFTLVYMLL